MKKFFFYCLLLITCSLTAQDIARDSAWILDHYTKQEVYIEMRDGIKLFTSIYAPKDVTEQHPILMTRTPYSCRPYGEDQWRSWWTQHNNDYFREGYIMVIQDVRGRWMSEGEFVDVRPFNPDKKTNKDIDEASDTYDTIDWLVKNVPNNNGNVGIYGISYPGFYSTMAALSGHPALKAVSPQAPVTDWFDGDDFHHNGAFLVMDAFSFFSSFGRPRPEPTTLGADRFQFPVEDNYKFFLEIGTIKNLKETYMGDSIKFWNDLIAHPNYDEWWQARNPRNYVKDVQPATMVVGGSFDAEDLFGGWETYKAIEEKSPNGNNCLVMGPWFHGQWARGDGSHLGHVQFGEATSYWYQNQIEVPFFNYHLKNKGNIDHIKEANVFFTGENKWHHMDQWPPQGKVDRMIYFQENGGLDWNKPTNKNSSSEYLSDPAKPVPYAEGVHLRRTREYMVDDQRFAARRPDVLVFQTEVLKEDLQLAGPVIAELLVSLSSTDADFVVKLIDVFPDDFQYTDNDDYPMGGYQMMVRGDIIRGRYRNSLSDPAPFTPNKVERVKLTLPDVAHTFKAGHRLMIQVQSTWFPLADRNPQQYINIYNCKDSDFRKATITLHHEQGNASGVMLPVVLKR